MKKTILLLATIAQILFFPKLVKSIPGYSGKFNYDTIHVKTGLCRINFFGQTFKCKYNKLAPRLMNLPDSVICFNPDNTLSLYDLAAKDTISSKPLKNIKHITVKDIFENSIRKQVVDSAYVDFSWKDYLRIFQTSKARKKSYLAFNRCFIVFHEDSSAKNCTFYSRLEFNQCLVYATFKNVTFNDTVLFFSSNIHVFIDTCKFNALLLKTDFSMGLICGNEWQWCYSSKFYNSCTIRNSQIESLLFEESQPNYTFEFTKNRYRLCVLNLNCEKIEFVDNTIYNCSFDLYCSHKNSSCYENNIKSTITVSKNTFNNYLEIENLFSDKTVFQGNIIEKNLKFGKTTPKDFNFKLNSFYSDVSLYLQYNGAYDSLIIPINVLSQINFRFDSTTNYFNSELIRSCEITSAKFDSISRIFLIQKHILDTLKTINDNLRKECIARIQYYLDYYELLYLRDKLLFHFDLFAFPNFVVQVFLFFIVNFGYHGELNFFITSLILIFTFAFLFKRHYYSEVNYFYSKQEGLKDFSSYFSIKRTHYLKFFQMLYFSTIILISPKFGSKYFQFSNRLLFWVIIEWTIGIFLVAVFIIYIASKYAFFKDLIGF